MEKVTKAEKGIISTTDIYQAAYLAMKKHEPKLSKQDGRVVFEFSGPEELKILVKNYLANPSVKVLDYAGQVKRLRAATVKLRK